MSTPVTGKEPAYRPLHKIADDITAFWPEPYFGAVPYIRVMRRMNLLTDRVGAEDGAEVARRFLVNAARWRGEHARRVKLELNTMLKENRL
jgi:hypothetical protein